MTAELEYLVDAHRIRTTADVDWLFKQPPLGEPKRTTCDHCGATARRTHKQASQWFLEHTCRDQLGRPVIGQKFSPTISEAQARRLEAEERGAEFWAWAQANPRQRLHLYDPEGLEPELVRMANRVDRERLEQRRRTLAERRGVARQLPPVARVVWALSLFPHPSEELVEAVAQKIATLEQAAELRRQSEEEEVTKQEFARLEQRLTRLEDFVSAAIDPEELQAGFREFGATRNADGPVTGVIVDKIVAAVVAADAANVFDLDAYRKRKLHDIAA